ncbi:MAG TPA: hypothetical protein VF572_05490 [Candidatus Saccharimonadales bacterium]|jgi:hypothetical protein
MQHVSKLRNYLSLFLPSSLSAVFGIFLTALAMILNQIDSIKEYLQIPSNLELFRVLAGWADTLLKSTIGESKTDVLVVGFFWALVGIIVYMFLRALARFIIELDDDIAVRKYVWPKGADRSRPLRNWAQRAAFRLVATIVLALVLAGPLAAVIRGPVFVDFVGPSVILQNVIWFFAGLLVWHIVTILIRLMALRARLFG